ncbi:MAG: hypothetical protein D6748_10200 [Calditrichaeota bacterium]|nr:MAG: hypothetical protein D6748_10200 [Calditrichota bacterium]
MALADRAKPLGFIPFAGENLSGYLPQLNRELMISLSRAGEFQILIVQRESEYFYDLGKLESLEMNTTDGPPQISAAQVLESEPSDSQMTVDSLSSKADSLAIVTPEEPQEATISKEEQNPEDKTAFRWILTGRFLKETEDIKRGTLIPFLVFSPSVVITGEVEFRIYDMQLKKWVAIDRLIEKISQKGALQFLEFNEADPSLILNGYQREKLRKELYKHLFSKLRKALVKHLKHK